MRKIKLVKTVFIYAIIILMVACVFKEIKMIITHNNNYNKMKKTITLTKVINENDKIIYKSSDADINSYSNLSFIKANLDELKSINKNTIGFINIPKIDFSFPIMNTDFYKNHSFFKSYDKYGMPYMYNETKNLKNQNTIIVTNKKVFSEYNDLEKVFTDKFLENDKNFIINLQINDILSNWQIISINKVKDFKYKVSFSDNGFNEYIDNLFFDSKYDFSVKVSDKEKILTIVLAGRKNAVITAKLIKMQSI